MAKKIKVLTIPEVERELENVLAEMIDSYQKELEINVEKELQECAEDFKNELYPKTPTSKKGKDHLRDNLTVTKKKTKNEKSFIVHFGQKGWLSTLQEYGWTTVNGRIIKRPAFIRPTFEKNKERYFNKIKEAVKRQAGDS